MDAVNRCRPTTPGERDRGSGEVLGLVLVAPVAIALAVLVVFVGRQVDSRAQVHSAAEAAAQAAALERTPQAARDAAEAVIEAMVRDANTCPSLQMTLDPHDFRAGGSVSVTVTCATPTSGLELIVAPDDRTFTVTATATIDPYRATVAAP
jgi:Flp pilus assembly protein TadG